MRPRETATHGTVIKFPKHHAGRASASSCRGASKPKRVGLTVFPIAPAAAVKIMNFSAGMPPRERQLLTAEPPTPHREATAAVPPSASMISSTVESITPSSSRNVDQSRDHITAIATTCEQWLNLPMITERDFQLAVAYRLRVLRKAKGKTQEALGEKMGVGKTAVSNYENGSRAVDPYGALQLKALWGVPLEWLYSGDESGLTAKLSEELDSAAKLLAQEERADVPRRNIQG